MPSLLRRRRVGDRGVAALVMIRRLVARRQERDLRDLLLVDPLVDPRVLLGLLAQ